MIEVKRLDASTVASDEGRRQIVISYDEATTHVLCSDGARLLMWLSGKWAEAEIRRRWSRWTP